MDVEVLEALALDIGLELRKLILVSVPPWASQTR